MKTPSIQSSLNLLSLAGFVFLLPVASAGDALSEWVLNDVVTEVDTFGVSFWNGTFVAGGDPSEGFLFSTNGINWIEQAEDRSDYPYRVAQGNGRFVGLSFKGNILSSSDGTNWISQIPATPNALFGVAYGKGHFVFAGANGTILTSTNAANWEVITIPGNPWSYGITFANGKFVAVGFQGLVLTSEDGVNWISRASGTGHRLEGIVFGKDRFVAVGGGGTVLTSPDGIDWTRQNSQNDSDTYFNAVCFAIGSFVAVGSDGANEAVIITSNDGIIWTRRSSPVTDELDDVIYGAGTFVVVTHSDRILRSGFLTTLEIDVSSYARLSLSGPIGHSYRIEYANDFGSQQVWSSLLTTNLTTSPITIIDPQSAAVPARFYRAVLLPPSFNFDR